MSFQKIDAILTLGGEDPIFRDRSELTYQLLQQLQYTRIGGAIAVLSGYCSGFISPDQRPDFLDSEAFEMATYLEGKGINSHQLRIESDSLDIIASFVYSRPILENLHAKNISVVSSGAEMPRVLKTAKYVLGTSYQIIPKAVNESNNRLAEKFREHLIRSANSLDFKLLNLNEDSNFENWERYLDTLHPFHGLNRARHLTAYGFPPFFMHSLKAIPKNYLKLFKQKTDVFNSVTLNYSNLNTPQNSSYQNTTINLDDNLSNESEESSPQYQPISSNSSHGVKQFNTKIIGPEEPTLDMTLDLPLSNLKDEEKTDVNEYQEDEDSFLNDDFFKD